MTYEQATLAREFFAVRGKDTTISTDDGVHYHLNMGCANDNASLVRASLDNNADHSNTTTLAQPC